MILKKCSIVSSLYKTFLIIAISVYSIILLMINFASGQESVQKYEVIELTFNANEGDNPYINKSMTCDFTGKTGAAVGYNFTVGGFWDGGSTWKCRYAPARTGTYTYITSSSDTELNGKTGTITVYNSTKRGRIQINHQYPLYFQWSNGDPYLMIGDTWWHQFYDVAVDAKWWHKFFGVNSSSMKPISWNGVSNTDHQTVVDTRISQRFNYAHVIVWYPPSHATLHGESPFIKDNKDKINPAFFKEVDKRIQYAANREYVIGLLNGWGDPGWTWAHFTDTQLNRFSQYLINRYGAYPIVWSGIGEYDEQGNNTRWEAFADYLRANDPYRNIVSMHTTTGYGGMIEEGHLDYYIIQKRVDYKDAVNARSKDMPFVNAEFGYESNISSEQILKSSWKLLMGGSAGIVYGHNGWQNDANLSALNSTGAEYIKFLSEFWQENGIEYWKFNSFVDLGDGRYEAKIDGGQHICWAETNGSFTIDLTDLSDTVIARWYNARTGEWGSEFILIAGQVVSVNPPDIYYALLVEYTYSR